MLLEYAGNGRWPSLYRGLRQTQEDVNRLLSGLQLAPQDEFPPVNVWTGTEGAVVTAELPGVGADQIDITVHGSTVTMRGQRDPEPMDDKTVVRRQERPHGEFVRTVALPFRVDPEKVGARFDRGIVFLELPRPDSDKPRHIKVMHA